MAARSLKVGDRVPTFALKDETGTLVRLEEILGRGPVVLFFYPKDETPGCTKEACAFRDVNADFIAAGAQVFGVSGDSVESHKSFSAHHNLNYRLLADTGDHVRNTVFGVPRGLLGLSTGRVTYVLDKGGVIRFMYEAMLNANGHVETAIREVKRLASEVPAAA